MVYTSNEKNDDDEDQEGFPDSLMREGSSGEESDSDEGEGKAVSVKIKAICERPCVCRAWFWMESTT